MTESLLSSLKNWRIFSTQQTFTEEYGLHERVTDEKEAENLS